MHIKIAFVIAVLATVSPFHCSRADEPQISRVVTPSQVDAAKVPMERWVNGFLIKVSQHVEGQKNDAVLKPIGRKPSVYDDVIVATLAEEEPVPRLKAIVPYPPELAKLGIPGAAVVTFVVSGSGKISDIRILEASDQRFGEAAKVMVSKWQYLSVKHDRKGRFLCILPVRFKVQKI